jgi:hypothetical protein
VPNPKGINQYSKGRGGSRLAGRAGGHSPWAAPNVASRISSAGPHSPPGQRAAAQRAASREIKKIRAGSDSNAAKAKKISAALQRGGVTVANQASHEAFIKAHLDKKKARKRR